MIQRDEDILPIDQIIHGDALETLQKLPSHSIDALCCDPPSGISFMGKAWDSGKGGRRAWIDWLSQIMAECLRVMKPGAHGLIWSLPRTSHWTATALEDAGFEIRDCTYHLYPPDTKVAAFYETLSQEQRNLFEQILDSQDTPANILHCFGSGFPKSHNISIAIDKMLGCKREVIGIYDTRSVYDGNERISNKTNGGGIGYGSMVHEKSASITAPVTPEANQYDGYGSALKPAVECWWLVRKPLAEPTLAQNVLKWGTGGINIDACRIAGSDTTTRHNSSSSSYMTQRIGETQPKQPEYITGSNAGRWPSHLLLSHTLWCDDTGCIDGCTVLEMDKQSGKSKGHKSNYNWERSHAINNPTSIVTNIKSGIHFDDEGGASRYFQTFLPALEIPFIYASKASKKDRSANGIVNNTHPTAKNTLLMKYLCALITPPGGIVLDCFAGSGSTIVACIQADYHYIGIEAEAEYREIAQARIAHARGAK